MKPWSFWAYLIIGIIYGYFNFRFGLRSLFVMTNSEGIRTTIGIVGGYLSLLPLTLIGIRARCISAAALLLATISAFIVGFFPPDRNATMFMLGRFVLPNMIVAGLMIFSRVNTQKQTIHL